MDYACFLALGFIWGNNFLLMKLAVEVLSPVQVLWLRLVCGALPLWTFGLLRRRMKLGDLRYAHHLIVLTFTSTVLPLYAFLMGAPYLNAGAAGSIAGIVPLLTAALAAVTLPDDRLTWRKSFGLLCGCVGVALVARADRAFFGQSADGALVGLGYMLAGALSYAVAVVYTKHYVMPLRMSSLSLSAYQTVIGALALSLFTPMTGMNVLFERPDLFVMIVIGLGVVGTGFSFIMYYHVIDRLGAVAASSVFYLPPVSALILGAIFAGEHVGWAQVVGAACILFGISVARPRAPLTRSA